jgi:hypothetical protein
VATNVARLHKAHREVVDACCKLKGGAILIERAAQSRLADEYDAAQKRGEIAKSGEQDRARKKDSVLSGNTIGTVTDIGLTRKLIHEARKVRDADNAQPGVAQRVIEEKVRAGEEPRDAAPQGEPYKPCGEHACRAHP